MAPALTLHFAPGTCARVSLVALEEARLGYALRTVDLAGGEQRTPDYLAVNPKGKVPALLVDGRLLTETPAILTWLARTRPEAALLPLGRGAFEDAQVQADLSYVSAGLHPITTRLTRPFVFSAVPGSAEGVYAMAAAAMQPNLALVERRLAQGNWWYGAERSMMDVYLAWIWQRVTVAELDVSAYPHFARLADQVAALPAAQRAEVRGEKGV